MLKLNEISIESIYPEGSTRSSAERIVTGFIERTTVKRSIFELRRKYWSRLPVCPLSTRDRETFVILSTCSLLQGQIAAAIMRQLMVEEGRRRRRRRWWWQGWPVTWPNQGQGEALGFVPDNGKPWPLANKFNPMTGISLRGENHITNIQKRYTTARCIMLPATSSIENWAVDCLQLSRGQDHR